MANQLLLALLALAVVNGAAAATTAAPSGAPSPGSCGADDDGGTQYKEFKPNLDHRWCSNHEGKYSKCNGECCRETDTCAGQHGQEVRAGGTKCKTIGHVYSHALASTITTKKDANVNCCEAEKKCDSYTCPTGWKDKAGKATQTCKNQAKANVCDTQLCCVVETKTCAGQIAAWPEGNGKGKPLACKLGTEYDSTKDATAMGTDDGIGNWYVATGGGCCKYPQTCGGQYAKNPWQCKALLADADYKDKYEHMYVTSASTAFTDLTEKKWMDACCTTELTKCSDYKCNADLALVSDHTKDDKRCMTGEGFGASEPGVGDNFGPWPDGGQDPCQKTCCKPDPTKCRGYKVGDMHEDEKCGGKYENDFKDDSGNYDYLGMKMNNIVTDHSTYKVQCCSKKLSCQNWKDGKAEMQVPMAAEAQASVANRQYMLVATPVLVALGMFA